MKLIFKKTEDEKVSVKVDGVDFSTKDYIKMITEIKNKGKIEAEFYDGITPDEQTSIEAMLKEINSINETNVKEGEEFNITGNNDDLPF